MYCNRKGRSELIWLSQAHFLMHHGSIPGTVALRAGSSSRGPVFSHTASVLDKSVVVCGGASGAFAVNVKSVVQRSAWVRAYHVARRRPTGLCWARGVSGKPLGILNGRLNVSAGTYVNEDTARGWHHQGRKGFASICMGADTCGTA